jgi:hypothetical protein
MVMTGAIDLVPVRPEVPGSVPHLFSPVPGVECHVGKKCGKTDAPAHQTRTEWMETSGRPGQALACALPTPESTPSHLPSAQSDRGGVIDLHGPFWGRGTLFDLARECLDLIVNSDMPPTCWTNVSYGSLRDAKGLAVS